ncbi:YDG/SRA domain-containing protein [Fibrella sp. HMF5335]|uniref:YDG/SRA domain-containing protein n=1 Tax=Fibrella rubiginis TaxID=2817060 RepID=A0A939K6R2_9BACT|nr:YDG/SRA domain-containing protein [Fibrella rubiginis]MBO0937825.1 YDG/SRA domain-containing protein [Fibrella rubiginis]
MPSKPKLGTATLADFRPGDVFVNRIDLSMSGLHRPRRAGISGTGPHGADSIILAGMYEDDIDEGDHIAYAGHGGRDQKTGKQIADQVLDGYNAALIRNVASGHPVRLVRGATLRNEHAPAEGYRYEGLFRVTSYERIRGKSGYWIWLFQLDRVS